MAASDNGCTENFSSKGIQGNKISIHINYSCTFNTKFRLARFERMLQFEKSGKRKSE